MGVMEQTDSHSPQSTITTGEHHVSDLLFPKPPSRQELPS